MKNIAKTNLASGFVQSLEKFPERPALCVEDREYSYSELWKIVNSITTTIRDRERVKNNVVAIFAHRSTAALAGILGVLCSGKGYVPLNPKYPIERTITMLDMCESKILIVGKECCSQLEYLIPKLVGRYTLIFPENDNVEDLSIQFPDHEFVASGDMSKMDDSIDIPDQRSDDLAYIMFTSGSTGIPKGVPVTHSNVIAYANYMTDKFDFNEMDKFSLAPDLTFDLSVHDLSISWRCGACLCPIPEGSVFAPAKFIKERKLTIWNSVPSVAMFMSKMKMLKPGTYPNLRYSFFCGEPLSASLAEKWQQAAPNSKVINLYGPTEATVAFTYYEWDSGTSFDVSLNDTVPIGWTFDTQKHCIIDKNRICVEKGKIGELCVSGSQVTRGYLNNLEKTQNQYVQIPSEGENIWYRTGDLVQEDANQCLHYFGRIDNQIKILGHRVELGEIDAALRKSSMSDMAISVAWPKQGQSASGIVGFVSGIEADNEKAILEKCQQMLPTYMVPNKIYFLSSLPLNTNGKIDRKKLVEFIEKGNL